MAIDINTLHIGAHVLVGGERREVFGLGCGRVSYLPHPVSSIAESVLVEDIEPIPITPELLTELGFEIKEEFGNVSAWKKDNLIVKIIGERKVVSFVDKMHSLETCYLHELEAFVYLATKTELIKE